MVRNELVQEFRDLLRGVPEADALDTLAVVIGECSRELPEEMFHRMWNVLGTLARGQEDGEIH